MPLFATGKDGMHLPLKFISTPGQVEAVKVDDLVVVYDEGKTKNLNVQLEGAITVGNCTVEMRPDAANAKGYFMQVTGQSEATTWEGEHYTWHVELYVYAGSDGWVFLRA